MCLLNWEDALLHICIVEISKVRNFGPHQPQHCGTFSDAISNGNDIPVSVALLLEGPDLEGGRCIEGSGEARVTSHPIQERGHELLTRGVHPTRRRIRNDDDTTFGRCKPQGCQIRNLKVIVLF